MSGLDGDAAHILQVGVIGVGILIRRAAARVAGREPAGDIRKCSLYHGAGIRLHFIGGISRKRGDKINVMSVKNG